jgi:hypothetical protein
MSEFDWKNVWTFNIGAAAINYHVYARDAAEAYKVACAWCKEKGKRLPAAVQPFIVAGPEVLNEKPIDDAANVAPSAPTLTERVIGAVKEAVGSRPA